MIGVMVKESNKRTSKSYDLSKLSKNDEVIFEQLEYYYH